MRGEMALRQTSEKAREVPAFVSDTAYSVREGTVLQDVLGLDRVNRLLYKQEPKLSIPKSIAAFVMQSTVAYYPRN